MYSDSTESGKNKNIFNLLIRKQQNDLHCGNNLMLDMSGRRTCLCLIRNRKLGQIATLISVLIALHEKRLKNWKL